MLKPRADDNEPATKLQIRQLRLEISALRSDLYKDLNDRTDELGERYDEISDIVLRNRRAINRIKKEVEDGG